MKELWGMEEWKKWKKCNWAFGEWTEINEFMWIKERKVLNVTGHWWIDGNERMNIEESKNKGNLRNGRGH